MTEYIGEWTTEDKSTWGEGPWQNEPDKVHWIDKATNLDCLMVRNQMGAWCGYVAVTEGHPAFEKDYDDVPVRVHGGLTFAHHCDEDDPTGICHVPQAGRPDRVWWLGFDCAHAWDLCPGLVAREKELGMSPGLWAGSVYRDRAWVEAEVLSLAKQLCQRVTVRD